MARRTPRDSAPQGGLSLPTTVTDALRAELPTVANQTIAAVIDQVPSYEGALSGPMGETIRGAVQLALGGFLNLASRGSAAAPMGPALEGAYRLGRGEARSGRSMEALLAAYRIGARVSWRDLSRTAVANGLAAEDLADFAELVFAYIDELSAASAAGHTDELERTGRVRERALEQLANLLLSGAPADAVVAAAERAEWDPPPTLIAVVLPESQVRSALASVDPRSLHASADLPEDDVVLLVAGTGSATARKQLLRVLKRHRGTVGHAVPWLEAERSFSRARRARALTSGDPATDTELRLAELVVSADPESLADLRARVLAPLADLRDSSRDKLTETLRAWLLHQGRRDDIAAALFVHPQTVRYRVGQLRELYGERLDSPDFVRDATIALAGGSGV